MNEHVLQSQVSYPSLVSFQFHNPIKTNSKDDIYLRPKLSLVKFLLRHDVISRSSQNKMHCIQINRNLTITIQASINHTAKFNRIE